METSTIEHFTFDKNDFHFEVSVESEDSKFDKAFKEKWSEIEQNNVLRYSVKHIEEKVLEGKYGFFAQVSKGTNAAMTLINAVKLCIGFYSFS